MSKLPSGYTELEYIESTGTQYIDTGCRVSKPDDYRMVLDTHLINNDNYAGCNGYMQFQANIGGGVRVTINISYKNYVETILVNGTQRLKKDWSGYNWSNVKLGIFNLGMINNGWISQTGQSGKLYSGQVFRASDLIRDFIPCKNGSGVVGLYDMVNAQFYQSVGSGDFTAGPEIIPDPPGSPSNLQSVMAVALRWAASEGAETYNVYRDGTKIGSTGETQYVDLTAGENETYTYTVTAENIGGESAGVSVTVYTKSGYFQYKPLIESANFP